ncbi:MAG: TetR/AcrR family transcriptional regulator [Deltaproteobacteria bacterium]|nr:TetR/AcrR family transcriptional regulator [Deltaproteobacteria bacterium]
MARPVGADAAATRARILDAAVTLVAERGIDGTSIRDIAAGAKVSLATVLHYYGSKEGLYDSCIDAMYAELDQLRGAIFTAFRPGVGVEQLLDDAVTAALTFVRQHRQANRILLRTILDEGGMRPERRDRYLGAFLDDVAAALAPVFGLDAAQVKIRLQSLTHLMVRYSLHNAAELKMITGAKSEADAAVVVERHLVEVARALFLQGRVP